MITRYQYRSQLIERTVNAFFKTNAQGTFLGHVTVFNVLDAVFDTLNQFEFRWNEKVRGEAFDQIRLLGPEGEGDVRWLLLYGGGQVKRGAA